MSHSRGPHARPAPGTGIQTGIISDFERADIPTIAEPHPYVHIFGADDSLINQVHSLSEGCGEDSVHHQAGNIALYSNRGFPQGLDKGYSPLENFQRSLLSFDDFYQFHQRHRSEEMETQHSLRSPRIFSKTGEGYGRGICCQGSLRPGNPVKFLKDSTL